MSLQSPGAMNELSGPPSPFFISKMKDWWPIQQKAPLQAPHWACYPLSSKYQLGFKGLPGPLTSSPWLLHSMLLYGTSSGTIIRWSCKGFAVHVWIATLIWLMMSLALSGAFSLYGFCRGVLACKTCEVRPWAFCEVMTALGWVTRYVPEKNDGLKCQEGWEPHILTTRSLSFPKVCLSGNRGFWY